MLVRGLDPGQCASWVQAWGSITAICAAALGIWWQVRKQRQQTQEQLIENAKKIINAVFWLRMSVIHLQVALREKWSYDEPRDAAIHWSAQLARLNLLDYPSWEVHNAAVAVIAKAARMEALPMPRSKTLVPAEQRVLRAVIEAAEVTELLVEKWLNRRGTYGPSQGFFIDGRTYNPVRRSQSEGDGIPDESAEAASAVSG